MRILMVAPTPFFADRGTHIRILEEALALEKRGHEITISTYHIGRDIHREINTKIDVRRIRRLLFWYKKLEAGPDWQKIILDIMLIRKTFFLARKKNPDIIHGHLHEGALIAWIVKKLLFWRKIKLVCDFHGSLTKEMVSHSYLSGGILKKIFSTIEKLINNLGDFAITSSWENTQEIIGTRKDKKVETILDGVNLNYYENMPSKIDSKKELELPLDKVIVTYTGALVTNKGTGYLFEAILDVIRKNVDAYFVIAGFPIGDAEEFIANNDLGSQVRLIHPLSYFDLPELLNASDISVDPKDSSTRQASGKILQYMAGGLPVVCFDKKNNKEYLSEGAYYSKTVSGKGISEGIRFFLNNRNEIEKKGTISRIRSKLFSWDASAEKIETIYKNIKI